MNNKLEKNKATDRSKKNPKLKILIIEIREKSISSNDKA